MQTFYSLKYWWVSILLEFKWRNPFQYFLQLLIWTHEGTDSNYMVKSHCHFIHHVFIPVNTTSQVLEGMSLNFGTNIHLPWLKYELIRVWWSKVKVTVTSCSRECDISGTRSENLITSGTNIHWDSRTSWLEFGGQGHCDLVLSWKDSFKNKLDSRITWWDLAGHRSKVTLASQNKISNLN